ncbi:Pet127-domain-containing protein [Pholiota conissans]|uniref:Pet127-domain-containing protein n=1 Tax=Pholiota conissans TaxID=109636 RepID=A0A9P6CV02_9AGAR|nr:Pet127-domain-containing protein [Pholiota conissans]
MITSSLSRLAPASTCLYGVKSPLCELAAARSQNLLRAYATVATTSNVGHVGHKNQKAVLFSERSDASSNKGSRKSSHVPRPLQYPKKSLELGSLMGKKKKKPKPKRLSPKAGQPGAHKFSSSSADFITGRSDSPTSSKKPSHALNRTSEKRRPKTSLENVTTAQDTKEEKHVTSDSAYTWPKETPIIRTVVPPARPVKKEKPTVVVKKTEEASIKTLSLENPDKKPSEESSKFGPGFVDDTWPPEKWDSEDSKRPPPHFVPTVNVIEGSIADNVEGLVDVAPPTEQLPVASLAHGLDRVLFNPGVHWLQDPRSHVYNFTPWLEKIPKVNQFAFEKLTGFIKSSQDEDLRTLAKQENKKYTGSTSSLSGMLSHIYFLISEHKDVELEVLSQHFSLEPAAFTSGQRMPAAVTLNFKDGVYSVDSLGSEYDDPDKNVLTWMGTLLENFLTKTPEDFKKFMRIESEPLESEEQKQLMREAFRFSKSDKFVMRSQLDCRDSRLPGTGVFDIKTRACISVRMDILNFEENSGYNIKSQHGIMESFEREYYDLVRSAFLKYSFQVRIGNMDGVMVAFHNTERIFGFQYISLDEMDERIYGPIPGIGDKVFKKSIRLLEAILEEATKEYPEEALTIMFETRRPGKLMDVFVQPAEWKGNGQKPITQFLVQVSHQVDGKLARSSVALRSTNDEWSMSYSIAKAVLPVEVVRHNLAALEKRKSRTLVLPASVSMEEAKEYWENLSFNPKLKAVTKDFNLMNFALADSGIQKFRNVSKEGRMLYEELQRRQEGKPKIVLGQGVYEEEESLFFKEPEHPAVELSGDKIFETAYEQTTGSKTSGVAAAQTATTEPEVEASPAEKKE